MRDKLAHSEAHQRILAILAIPLYEIERVKAKAPRRPWEPIPPHPLEVAVKEMFDYSYVGTDQIEQERAANYLWARQWFRDDPERVDVANYLDPSNHTVWYRMAQSYNYKEITLLCSIHLGSRWFDYFYDELPSALQPGSAAFDTLVQCAKNGWTEGEISSHPIYGIHINAVGYHPRMKRLLSHFPSSKP